MLGNSPQAALTSSKICRNTDDVQGISRHPRWFTRTRPVAAFYSILECQNTPGLSITGSGIRYKCTFLKFLALIYENLLHGVLDNILSLLSHVQHRYQTQISSSNLTHIQYLLFVRITFKHDVQCIFIKMFHALSEVKIQKVKKIKVKHFGHYE